MTNGARNELEALQEIAGMGSVVDLEHATALADVTALLGASPGDDVSALSSLRWVHSTAAGVDGCLRAGTFPEHVRLTSAAGNGAIPLAEYALMLMLSRDAPRWARAQQRHDWERRTHGELAGARLGITGYGYSGKDLAQKALACHMGVQALRRQGTPRTTGT